MNEYVYVCESGEKKGASKVGGEFFLNKILQPLVMYMLKLH